LWFGEEKGRNNQDIQKGRNRPFARGGWEPGLLPNFAADLRLTTTRLVAVGAFGYKKAPFPAGFVKFFVENTRFRLQNLPIQPEK